MREIRPSGSEGGGPARKAGLPTPIQARVRLLSPSVHRCCGLAAVSTVRLLSRSEALGRTPSPSGAAHRRAACASEGADVPVARCGLVEAEGSAQMAAFAPSDLPDFSSVLAHDAPPCPRCYQSRVAGQQVCSEKSVGECRGGHGRVASSAATVDGGRNAASPGWPPVESCQRFSAAARASQQADDRGSAA